jgi:hypothetical protein
MKHITCRDCVYNISTVDPNTKNLTKNCTRNPPTAHAILTQQGIAMICSYPVIKDDMQACGEWDDGADIVIESVPLTQPN